MDKNEYIPKTKEKKQASAIIGVVSVVGLTVCFVAGSFNRTDLPIWLYAIFGGGILGTENVLNLLKTVFRIGK